MMRRVLGHFRRNALFIILVLGACLPLEYVIIALAQVTPVVETAAVAGGTPINWNTIILAVISLIGTALTGVMAIFLAKVSANTKSTVVSTEATRVAAVEAKEAVAVVAEKAATVAEKAEKAAESVETVRTDLRKQEVVTAQRLDAIAQVGIESAKVGRSSHVLLNANMGVQLKIAAVALRRVADITKDRADIQNAELAEHAYAEHMKQQAVVDKQAAEDAGR
jgi:hypothetical protein